MGGRWFGTLMTLAIISAASLPLQAGGRETAPVGVGYIAAKGSVWVDGQLAPSGTVIFAGDVVKTGKGAAAILNLRSDASVSIGENSEISVSTPGSAPLFRLERGAIVVRSSGQRAAQVRVLGAFVNVKGQAGFPAICRIAALGGGAAIAADQGIVEVQGKGAPLIVSPGKYVRLEAGPQQAAELSAGRVTNAIPEEVIQHQAKGSEIKLNLNDSVHWEDLVRTVGTGRVRIQLTDGSFLNIGVRSAMRIVKHDAESQQTEIELTLGRLRGEVRKLSKPGASVQVRTPTAVIGVVGTIFWLEALAEMTRVTCIEGALRVRNIVSSVAGEVVLRAGQSTTVPRGQPPGEAVSPSTQDMIQQVSQTNAGEALSTEVGEALRQLGASPSQIADAGRVTLVGRPPVPTGAPAPSAPVTSLHAVRLGIGVTGVAVSGVAAARAGGVVDASEAALASAAQAENAAQGATSAANDAFAAANFAQGVATDFLAGVEAISAFQPCGCRGP